MNQLWQKVIKLPSRNPTVKYMFPLMLGTLAIFFASAISADKSYVKLVPSETMVANGDSFSIDVYVNAHVPINAVDISIGFSPEMVSIKDINVGNTVITIWTEEPKVENNIIKFSGGTFKRGFLGEHLIGTINATAKYNGNTEFFIDNVQFLAGDGKGTSVLVDRDNTGSKTSFYIYDQDEDPNTISAEVKININADINGDGKVTISDIRTFLISWGSRNTTYDFNNDGNMNIVDFSIILSRSILDIGS